MNFENLGHFEAVARHRSFVHAADHLHMSQPALTRSIQVLERELGGRLFDRRPHKVELTGFGSFVLERVRALISAHQQLNRDIDLFKGVESGNLYVGFGPITAEALAGPCVGRFMHEHPRIRLRVFFLASDEMAEALVSGQIDVLVGEPLLRKPQPELIMCRLKKRRAFFYCRVGHPLLQKKSPKLSDLAEYPFVGFVLPPRIARIPEADRGFGHIDSTSGNLIPQVECYSVAAAKQIVAASNGIGTATFSMVKRELHAGVLVPIALMVPGLETDYSIITLRGRTLTPAAEAFVNIVRAVDEEMDESLPTFGVSRSDKQRHRMVSLNAKS
jgi:DNA-binding transcriptional LysR family regulator